jgi:hypothetical protein
MTDDFVDGVISNLRILSMIPKGGKLCVRKGQLSIDTVGRGQFVWRWVNGDSRDNTMNHVRNTISSAIAIITNFMNQYKNDVTWISAWTINRLCEEMERCEAGMCNLRTTYADDAAVVAALFTMSERIKAHCKEIKKSPAASIVHKE